VPVVQNGCGVPDRDLHHSADCGFHPLPRPMKYSLPRQMECYDAGTLLGSNSPTRRTIPQSAAGPKSLRNVCYHSTGLT
jgi:hypothetical protein